MKLKTRYPRYLIAAAIGLASAVAASAQLLTLNGLTAQFQNLVPPGTGTINNGATVQTFQSSAEAPSMLLTNTLQPVPQDFMVGEAANFVTFSVLDSDKIATSLSPVGAVDLQFDFDFQGGAATDFTIVYTYTKTFENADFFSYTLTPGVQSGAFMIDEFNYTYTIVGDGMSGSVGIGADASIGQSSLNMDISFTAVPEPSTYALFGVIALGGIVAFRRYRGGRGGPTALPALV